MLEDRWVTIRELCELIPDVSVTITDKILTAHLHYHKVRARRVPRMLNKDHKRRRAEAGREFLDCYAGQGEEFLDLVITGDKRSVPSEAAFSIDKAAKF